jgi:DNA-directed RNA polymerase subunit beta'
MAATAVAHPQTGEILLDRNEEIDEAKARSIVEAGITEVPVRSPLTCEARRGVCQLCYGRLPASGVLVEQGQAAGIIAAQSIGEPGTQLTMRTFHTGGIAGVDITSGLPRVEELFEARVPKGAALLADIDGVVEIIAEDEGRRIRVVSREEFREDYALPKGALVLVDDGEYVEPGVILAQAAPPKKGKSKVSAGTEAEAPLAEELIASIGGHVELSKGGISIVWEDVEEREYVVPASAYIMVADGAEIRAGDALTAGPLNPHDILHIRGKDELQRYQVDQVQQVYRSQGVSIHDKHIEIILSRMLRRVQVESIGDADFIPGQLVDKFDFQDKNARVLAEGGEPATAKPVLLGVTRASLLTDSFLAAASFQETTRVLTQAAVSGAHDWLLGLKENVIIGRLIPARLESLSSIVEPDPEPLLEIEDMVPAGWLDMASEVSSQFPFMSPKPENPGGTAFFLEEAEDNGGALIGDDDEDDEDFLGEEGLLSGAENSGEVNGPPALPAIDEHPATNNPAEPTNQ